MANPSNKDSNNIIHAMVVASQKVIDLMGKDLQGHFIKHKVSLVNVSPAQAYGPDAITLVLAGKQEDIKNSLSQLKRICNSREAGIESSPIKLLPPALKGYLSDMEDDCKFEKIFLYCSKEYLQYCKQNNIHPHPEVAEIVN